MFQEQCAVNQVPDALIQHVAMDMAIKHERVFGKSAGDRARAPPAHDALQNLSHCQKGGHGLPVGVATAQGEMSSGQGEYWPV